MKLTPKQVEKLKAFHEAGHAVIARVQGVGITYATILSTNEITPGSVLTECAAYRTRDADKETQLNAIMMDMVICFAGPFAQGRHRPPKRRGRNPDEWESDLEYAVNFAARAALVKRGADLSLIGFNVPFTLDADDAAEGELFLKHAEDKARRLVDEHWPAITRVTEALLIRHVLSQDDVDKLIGLPRSMTDELGCKEVPVSQRIEAP